MKKKTRQFICSMLVIATIGLGANTAYAASFGNSSSGASSVEVFQVKYNGAAWNYSSSPYKWTMFKYTRNGRTLLSRTAYSSKVTGSVWDDIRWGDKYTTKFSWDRGARK
ncbi:hypothetical protein Pryu01_02623 [Paraliobacillus ryukyuensis]|uniref:Lactococcin 972 family bacteriocin n=1 Tax=Paraliobacillus ryukyuensis TaxID=200904 RepID=A0A366DYY4_9BACI|nr:hypothetical protein [Paraliobacillus ryukyuensis]RBO95293.1 hypothetical protein DES48_1081 [Paraliobacillus ryukyuensis]